MPEPLLRYRQHAGAVTDRQGDASEARSLAVQRRLLGRLGLEPEDEAARFHRLVGHGAEMRTSEEMQRAQAWLMTVAEANARAGVYDAEGLRRAIGFVWHRLALNSARGGAWAHRLYRAAPFAEWFQPSLAECLQMGGTTLLAPLRRGDAGRAGVRGRGA